MRTEYWQTEWKKKERRNKENTEAKERKIKSETEEKKEKNVRKDELRKSEGNEVIQNTIDTDLCRQEKF
jgi:predicted Holliday junction resolvase-like endonuclease